MAPEQSSTRTFMEFPRFALTLLAALDDRMAPDQLAAKALRLRARPAAGKGTFWHFRRKNWAIARCTALPRARLAFSARGQQDQREGGPGLANAGKGV